MEVKDKYEQNIGQLAIRTCPHLRYFDITTF